jgi:hypothetical protein
MHTSVSIKLYQQEYHFDTINHLQKLNKLIDFKRD